MLTRIAQISSVTVFALVMFTGESNAQTCALKIKATAADTQAAVNGVTATAIRRINSQRYTSIVKKGQPFFTNLPSGEYRVTVSKAGFKRTIDTVTHSCLLAKNGVDTAYISLWPGSAALAVDLSQVQPRRVDRFTVLGSKDESVTPSFNVRLSSNETPAPPSPPKIRPQVVSGGVLNGKALSLPRPAYPPAARAARAGGSVSVQVLIDHDGKVISASAVSGHPRLRSTSEAAARMAKFSPTLLSGQPVKVSGIIVYNFQ